jgi:hypothetical protein
MLLAFAGKQLGSLNSSSRLSNLLPLVATGVKIPPSFQKAKFEYDKSQSALKKSPSTNQAISDLLRSLSRD